MSAEGLCGPCRIIGHDTCPLVDGCSCCADTRERADEGGAPRCVVCHLSAPRHGTLCCDHRYDEQPPCPECVR